MHFKEINGQSKKGVGERERERERWKEGGRKERGKEGRKERKD